MALNQEGRVDGAKTVTLSVECMYYDYFGETLICFSLPVDRGFQCIAIHIFFFGTPYTILLVIWIGTIKIN